MPAQMEALMYAQLHAVRDNNFSELLALVDETSFAFDTIVLFVEAAGCGRLEMCQWLHAVRARNARARENSALRWAATNGHLGVCQWLHATFSLTTDDARSRDNDALRWAAKNGHLAVCQWLHATYGLTAADARAGDSGALCSATANGHLGVCQWLYSVGIHNWELYATTATPTVAAWIRSRAVAARLRALAAELLALADA